MKFRLNSPWHTVREGASDGKLPLDIGQSVNGEALRDGPADLP
jgi:hypothetical protein